MGDDRTRTPKSSGAVSPALDVTIPADGGDGDRRGVGSAVGRYVLGEPLGSGGMGVVYRARDPDLDRELAIKLVLPAIVGRRAHDRLLSEARAMAKLRHPNVVPVFDVGITEQGVYVVMPLVPGGTLHDWLSAEPRPWRDVVARFVAAGRGLAAAHAVGIVHRDFKPRNVLLDEHGTVMVADFGLANAAAAASADADRGDAVVTSVVGTPAYMAPEQAAGSAVDARADQFSFCISFWEGLHGRRPSAAETAQGTPVDAAPAPEPAASGREAPPTWLQLAIARGFSDDADRRWPSINTLLDEIGARLDEGRRGSARRPWLWAAAGVAGVGGVALAAMALRDEPGARDRTTAAAVPPDAEPAGVQLGTPRKLTDSAGGCAYAPVFLDDDTVAYELTKPTGEVDLYTLELASGAPKRVTDGPNWDWRSSRGLAKDELLYVVTDLQQAERGYAAARDLVTGNERRISSSNASAITSHGDAYYYITSFGRELRVQRGNVDEKLMTLTEIGTPQCLIPSPDGKELAMTGMVSGMYVGICLADLESRTLSCPETTEVSSAARVDYGTRGDLYFVARDGIRARRGAGPDRLVMPTARAFGGVAIAPNGRTLVYSDCTALGTVREVGVEPARDLSDEDRLGEPVAGPGGTTAWIRGRRELVVRTADGAVRNLFGATQRGDALSSPAFDRVGGRVAIKRGGVNKGIWIVDVARVDHEQQVTYDGNDFAPLFLLDDSIVFHRTIGENDYVFRVVPGEEAVQVIERPRETVDIDRSTGRILLRSPDQKFLYWWDPITGKETKGPPTYPPGTQNTRDISISPNGRWLLYQSGTLGHEVWRTPVASWKPELVFKASEGSSLDRTSITDDGHPLVIERIWHGELYAVDATSGTL